MKKVKIIIISSLIIFLSCKNKVADANPQKKPSTESVNLEKTKNKIEDYTKTQSFKNCNETFKKFLERFSKDSLFQKSRVKYPLKWSSLEDNESSKIIVDIISNNKYNYIDFTKDKDAMNNEYDKYEIDIEDLDSIMNYRLKGYDNGINITHKFKLIDDCWYMVEILDQST